MYGEPCSGDCCTKGTKLLKLIPTVASLRPSRPVTVEARSSPNRWYIWKRVEDIGIPSFNWLYEQVKDSMS